MWGEPQALAGSSFLPVAPSPFLCRGIWSMGYSNFLSEQIVTAQHSALRKLLNGRKQ
ncbi:hypothetical protein ACRRTK_009025 [Alexandromys fortis]